MHPYLALGMIEEGWQRHLDLLAVGMWTDGW
jgi:hypothetical protein